jgi:hypothetical protein
MKTAPPPNRCGAAARPESAIPAPLSHPPVTLRTVSIRYSVQADTRDECVEGLEHLVQLGLVPVMLPVQVMDDRWMARAVPRPPAVEDAPAET